MDGPALGMFLVLSIIPQSVAVCPVTLSGNVCFHWSPLIFYTHQMLVIVVVYKVKQIISHSSSARTNQVNKQTNLQNKSSNNSKFLLLQGPGHTCQVITFVLISTLEPRLRDSDISSTLAPEAVDWKWNIIYVANYYCVRHYHFIDKFVIDLYILIQIV